VASLGNKLCRAISEPEAPSLPFPLCTVSGPCKPWHYLIAIAIEFPESLGTVNMNDNDDKYFHTHICILSNVLDKITYTKTYNRIAEAMANQSEIVQCTRGTMPKGFYSISPDIQDLRCSEIQMYAAVSPISIMCRQIPTRQRQGKWRET
jgi:hypothetical protein